MQSKKASESQSHLTWIVNPSDLNRHGTLFGGQLLALADRVAAMAAMRHSRQDSVTVSIDKVDFVAPVHRGYILDMTARVHFTARTSMEIYVESVAEEPRSGKRELVCEAFFSFVAVDENNKPIPVPPVELETERDRKLNADALKRYNERKAGKRAKRTGRVDAKK